MVTQPANAISKVALCAWADGKTNEKVKIPPNFVPCEPACRRLLFPLLRLTGLFSEKSENIERFRVNECLHSQIFQPVENSIVTVDSGIV